MAASDPISAVDLASGVNLARARGAADKRTIDLAQQEHERGMAEFRRNLAKARKKAVAGDIMTIAGFLAPTALAGLGSALGGTAAASAVPMAGATGVTGTGIGQSLVNLGTGLRTVREPLARTLGNIAGDPSAEVTGLTGLMGEIAGRRRHGVDDEELKRLRAYGRSRADYSDWMR